MPAWSGFGGDPLPGYGLPPERLSLVFAHRALSLLPLIKYQSQHEGSTLRQHLSLITPKDFTSKCHHMGVGGGVKASAKEPGGWEQTQMFSPQQREERIWKEVIKWSVCKCFIISRKINQESINTVLELNLKRQELCIKSLSQREAVGQAVCTQHTGSETHSTSGRGP